MNPSPAPEEPLPSAQELDAFERELRGFQPAAPSAASAARIRAELGANGAREKVIAFPARVSPFAWTATAAAAAVAVAAGVAWLWPRPTTESAPPRFGGPVIPAVRTGGSVAAAEDPQWRQVRADTEWEDTTDEGVVTAPGDPAAALAMHRLRGVFRDTFEWQDARTGAVLTIQYPREEYVAQAAGPF